MAGSDRDNRKASHSIRSISVHGGFLDGLHIEFSDGLNCVIGARGTGKTTIVELIRFAFDALPSPQIRPDQHRKVSKLIEHNLAGGRVQVGIQTRDRLSYIVSRCVGESPVILTDDGQPT